MPPRHQFYDPIVQEPFHHVEDPPPAAPPPMQAIVVGDPGLYLRAEDVAASLRYLADHVHAGDDARGCLLSAAESFAAVPAPGEPEVSESAPASAEAPESGDSGVPSGSPDAAPAAAAIPVVPLVDPHPEVARVEVYPDEKGHWHARPVDAEGGILSVTAGSFDRDYVERDAAERWPGKELHEVADASFDSIWDEQHHAFGWNGRRRPSPRRMFTS